MALEIRELVVKVTVTEERKTDSKGISEKEKVKLVKDCVKQVMKQLKSKRER